MGVMEIWSGRSREGDMGCTVYTDGVITPHTGRNTQPSRDSAYRKKKQNKKKEALPIATNQS